MDKQGRLPLTCNRFDTVHVPTLIGNWGNHYRTGPGSSLSASTLPSIEVENEDDYDFRTRGRVGINERFVRC